MPTLYKYRPFATSADMERAFATIRDRSFWFSFANKVNDPFEFRCGVSLSKDFEGSVRAFAMVERVMNPSATPEAALSKARTVLNGVPKHKLLERQWEISYNLWKTLGDAIAMCCFAGVPDSILM